MTPATWGTLLLAWIAALALPGPDIFVLLRLGIRSRAAAVKAAFGIMAGNFLWITATVLGISALLRAFPVILPIIQIAGSIVLITIGVQSVRAGTSQLRTRQAAAIGEVSRRPFALGFVTNIANPKALIFFTALLSQFLPVGAPWGVSVLIIVVMWIVGIAWFVIVALASSSRAFRAWFGRAAPWFDIVAGAVFVIVAGVILIEVLLGLGATLTSPR